MTNRYAYFLDGPKQGQTMRITPDCRFVKVIVPNDRDRINIDFTTAPPLPRPIQHDTVTYRQTDLGKVASGVWGVTEEWSVEGRPRWASNIEVLKAMKGIV